MTAPRDPFFPAERSIRASDKPLEVRFLGRMDYQEAWDYQAEVAAARAKGEQDDVVLVVEHPNIYTAGKRTQPEDMPDNGLPVITVDRGGRITWHGEGQLVIYPIIKLAEPVDVVDYVRRLEEATIQDRQDHENRKKQRAEAEAAASGRRKEEQQPQPTGINKVLAPVTRWIKKLRK